MKKSKKVQFNVLKQDITVELQPKRRGIYWHYQDVPFNYGPFKSDDQANTGNELLAVLDDIVETVDYDNTIL